jgi:type IV pilus assembly protein PilE
MRHDGHITVTKVKPSFGRTWREGGFTLIELMIVLAIVAILAAIAYPSYNRFITKSARDEARSSLQQIELLQERWRQNNGGFATNAQLSDALGALRTADLYEYSITTSGRSGFTAVATAIGRQAARETALFGGACNALTLEATLAGVTRSPAACW